MVIFEDALPEQAASRQLAKDLVSGEWWKEIAEKKLVFATRPRETSWGFMAVRITTPLQEAAILEALFRDS